MTDVTELSLVIPTFNESEIIGESIQRLCSYLDGQGLSYEIIVCDDDSTDGTTKTLEKFVDKSEIKILKFERRIGKGGTIKNALRAASGHIIMFVDADLPVELNDIIRVYGLAKTTDGLLIGIRNSESRATQSFKRRLLSVLFNALVRILFWTGVSDHQCGIKATTTENAKRLFNRSRSDGFLFDTELIVNAKHLGITVLPTIVEWRETRKNNTKIITGSAAVTMMIDSIALRLSSLSGRQLLELKQLETGKFVNLRDGKEFPIRTTVMERDDPFFRFLRRIYLALLLGKSKLI